MAIAWIRSGHHNNGRRRHHAITGLIFVAVTVAGHRRDDATR